MATDTYKDYKYLEARFIWHFSIPYFLIRLT